MNLRTTTEDDEAVFDLFGTPRHLPAAPWEPAALATARSLQPVGFRDDHLPIVAWGRGPVVLLVHGWAARTAHLAVLAGRIAEAGFTAVAYDGPGHTPAAIAGTVDSRATLVDVARAVNAVGRHVGPMHAVVGHSMGAAAAALAATGRLRRLGLDEGPRVDFGDRLVLLASPDRLTDAAHAWAAQTGRGPAAVDAILREGQRRYTVPLDAFTLSDPDVGLPPRTLLIHDGDDAEVPITEAQRLDRALGGGHLVTTRGLGHGRVLIDPDVAARVVAHLR